MKVLWFAGLMALALAKRKEGTQEDFEFVEDKEVKQAVSKEGKRTWILDPDNALCSLLRCGSLEICLLQDRFTAVCANRQEIERNGDKIVPVEETQTRQNEIEDEDWDADDEDDLEDDEDDEDGILQTDDLDDDNVLQNDDDSAQKLNRRPFARKQCPSCPVVRPVFLCGSDNRTYSSLCRLHYHNCIHGDSVRISCKGFCPCKDPTTNAAKKRTFRKRNRSNRLSEMDNKMESSEFEKDESDNRVLNRFGKYKHKTRMTSSKNDKKYNKYNSNKKRDWKQRQPTHELTNSVWGPNECSQSALEAMGNRMLDWFSVIMSDYQKRGKAENYKQRVLSWCKPEVAWMLSHLDADDDGLLSPKELYQLEHDERERCIKPFIDRCDLDRDVFLSGREWCKCFDKSERPCAVVRRSSKGLIGGYIPECDSEGYYVSTQCHTSAGWCWCVDKHGVELPNSRTRGAPNCDVLLSSANEISNHIDSDLEDGDDEVDVIEGSADIPLDF